MEVLEILIVGEVVCLYTCTKTHETVHLKQADFMIVISQSNYQKVHLNMTKMSACWVPYSKSVLVGCWASSCVHLTAVLRESMPELQVWLHHNQGFWDKNWLSLPPPAGFLSKRPLPSAFTLVHKTQFGRWDWGAGVLGDNTAWKMLSHHPLWPNAWEWECSDSFQRETAMVLHSLKWPHLS